MITQTSQIYANSLLELNINDIEIQLLQIDEIFKQSLDLTEVLLNPSINISAKIDVIDAVFKNRIDEKLVTFLKVLTEKNRIAEFSQIVQNFEKMLDDKNNIKRVEILSATDLTEDYKNKILKKLEQKLHSEIKPHWEINPEIISGLVFKYGDTVIDSSLKTKIENFGKIMK